MARLTGSGIKQFADGETLERRMARFEAEVTAPSPDHVWVFSVVHRLSDASAEAATRGENVQLDMENVVMAGGPICYRCEAATFNKFPCPGYRDHNRTDPGHIVEGSGGTVEAEIVGED